MKTALLALLLAAPPALADAHLDLAAAASAELPEPERQAAFDRLVALGATDMAVITHVSADDAADARQRWVATRALGKVGGDRARSHLLTLLDDPMPAMRAAAAQALGDTADTTVVEPVAGKLGDPAVIVRAAAAEALGKLGNKAAVPALSRALDASDNYYRGSSLWVRKHYVVALGQIADKSAVPALLRGLDDADAEVVAASVWALERIAGFSFSEGRTDDEEREAWRRWASAQIRQSGG